MSKITRSSKFSVTHVMVRQERGACGKVCYCVLFVVKATNRGTNQNLVLVFFIPYRIVKQQIIVTQFRWPPGIINHYPRLRSSLEWQRFTASGKQSERSKIPPPSASQRSTANSRSDSIFIFIFKFQSFLGFRWKLILEIENRIWMLRSSRPQITSNQLPKNAIFAV